MEKIIEKLVEISNRLYNGKPDRQDISIELDDIIEELKQLTKQGVTMTKYYEKKAHARQIAIDWQSRIASRPGWSWEWVAEWYARFERIGRKYGLLKEFKENGIL